MEQVSWPWPGWDPTAATAAADRVPAPAVSRRVNPPGRAQKRVLVLDDDPSLGLALSRVLARCGHEVHLATTPAEAFDVLAGGEIDVVVCDTAVAETARREWAEGIRAHHPGLPILFLTGNSNPEAVLPHPLVGLVTRPFGPDAVDRGVRELIATAEAGRRLRSLIESGDHRDHRRSG